jgi:hypothetical protein
LLLFVPLPAPVPAQGSQVEALQREVQELRGALAAARGAADAAQAERDAYRLSAREIQDRSKVGACALPQLAGGATLAPATAAAALGPAAAPLPTPP